MISDSVGLVEARILHFQQVDHILSSKTWDFTKFSSLCTTDKNLISYAEPKPQRGYLSWFMHRRAREKSLVFGLLLPQGAFFLGDTPESSSFWFSFIPQEEAAACGGSSINICFLRVVAEDGLSTLPSCPPSRFLSFCFWTSPQAFLSAGNIFSTCLYK